MSFLSASWLKRLEAAQLDLSWQAQLEARVLRFLLSRYGDANEEAPLPDCPVFQGEAPRGRAKLPLSDQQLRARLSHIAQVAQDIPLEPLSVFEVNQEKRLYDQARRKRRLEKRHERGY